jgi:hypothetical protein
MIEAVEWFSVGASRLVASRGVGEALSVLRNNAEGPTLSGLHN